MNDGGLDFGAIHALDIGIAGNGGNGHAAAKAHDEDAARHLIDDGSQVAEKKLRGRVSAGGVDFAVGGESKVIVGAVDGDGGVEAVGDEGKIEGSGVFGEREFAVVKIEVKDGGEGSERTIVKNRGKTCESNEEEQHGVESERARAARRCG